MPVGRKRTGRFWPTPVQERLLVAALGDPDGAVAAWSGLPPSFSLDELEPGSFELMPLVYRNLSSAGYEDGRLPRLKGIYRRAWVRNNLLLERTRDIAEALRTADIRTLFLEGAVIALRYYPDLGLRPTSSIHVLVSEVDEAAAVTRLQRNGWSCPDTGPSLGWRFLFDDGGNTCVLRTSIAFDFVLATNRALSVAPLWETAERHEVAGADVLVPTPTDSLLAICASAARLAPISRTQWVTDAAMVLRGHEVDWERLVELGISRGQALRLRDAFDYLTQLPGAHPPGHVRLRLAGTRVVRRQRLIYGLSSGSIRGFGGVPFTVAEHLVATSDESLVRTISTFPAYLRDRWGLPHGRHLPFAAGRRLIDLGRKRAP
jgi:hypothetical protein